MSPEQNLLIDEITTRSVDQIIDKENILEKLKSGRKLVIKLGIDPTSPNIHLGRAIPLLRLKKFQRLGHKIVLVIGDFTGVIGDTSDKNSERPMLTHKQIEKNLLTYKNQVAKLIDLDKAEIRYNSEWLNKVTYLELCEQTNVFSVNDFISRSNIKTRLDKGLRVSLREVLYPLMQGYDSVVLKADIELGGSDQWFNLLAGRELQKHYNQKPQDIITNPLIEGLDGRKMSSSWGNTINLMDTPKDMYGKVMSLQDELIIKYFEHCTEVEIPKVSEYDQQLRSGKISPRDLKDILAYEITKLYWGTEGAEEGRSYFNNVIREKNTPKDIKEVKVQHNNILEVLVETQLAESKGDAKRLVRQGGVKVDGEKVNSLTQEITSGATIQKGPLNFIKITILD